MSRRRWTIAIVAGIVVLAALAVGLALLATAGSSTSTTSSTADASYAELYQNAIVGTSTESAILAEWPKALNATKLIPGLPPRPTCYEWIAPPETIYSLCFRHGVLIDKAAG